MKNGVGVHTYNSHTEEKPPSFNYYSILTEDDEVVKANYTPRLSAEANTAVRLRTKSCLTCSLLHVTHLGCYTQDEKRMVIIKKKDKGKAKKRAQAKATKATPKSEMVTDKLQTATEVCARPKGCCGRLCFR